MYWFFVFLGVSFVADIILLAVVGNNAVQANTFANTTETNTMVFGVATTAINVFIKAALAYFLHALVGPQEEDEGRKWS